jgi:transcriptional regulator with XRE-family HTH domain
MLMRLDLKLRRIAAGYRQQDVAARIGINSSRYSALERGEAELKAWEMEALDRLLPPWAAITPAENTIPAREPRR